MKPTYTEQLEILDSKAELVIEDLGRRLRAKLKEAGADGYVIGLSGGLDSAVVTMLCARANIDALLISMPNGSSMSKAVEEDCAAIAQAAGYMRVNMNIQRECQMVLDSLNSFRHPQKWVGYASGKYDIVVTNIPPRVRMLYLYGIAGAWNYLVANTCNLSENMMGYSTKWGDMCGDIEVLNGFTKSEIRVLAKHLGIPQNIIDKQPSAELWDGQTDEEEMGLTYEELDTYIMTGYAKEDIRSRVENAKARTAHKRDIGITLDRYDYLNRGNDKCVCLNNQ